MENKEKNRCSISDYLSILFKWKNFFLSIMFLVFVFSVVLALLLPKQYRATATFMIPASKDMGLGGLGGLLSGESSALDIGTRLLGVTNTNEDMLVGFMYSRPIITQMAKRYNLYEYYGIDDFVYEDFYDAFLGDLQIEPNEFGFVDVSVINEDPVLAAKMANDFVQLADSLNIYFNIKQAQNYTEFVEKRYFQTLADLEKAENDYYEFQKKYGVFDIPEQIKAMVESTSQIEAQIIQSEILIASIKNQYGQNSQQYAEKKFQLEQLKDQLRSVYKGKSEDDFFISIKEIPELQIEYLRRFRELEIQNQTLKYIYPIVEQARIDEKKNIPTLLLINEAAIPQKKYLPKRMFIVLGFMFFAFWIAFGIILRGEKILTAESRRNFIEEKEFNFFKSLTKKFKIRI